MNSELQKLNDFIKLAGFFSTLRSGLKNRVSQTPAGMPNILPTESVWSVFKRSLKDTDPVLAPSTWKSIGGGVATGAKAVGSGVATGAKAVGSGAMATGRGAKNLVKRMASHDEVKAIDSMIKNRELLAEQYRRLDPASNAATVLKNQISAMDNNIFTARQQLGGITDRLTFGSRANAPTSAAESWQYGGIENRVERAISGGQKPGRQQQVQLPQTTPTPTQPPAPAGPSMWDRYTTEFNKNPWMVGGLTAGGLMLANNAIKGGNSGGGNRAVIL